MSHHYSGPDYDFPREDARLDLTDLYAFPKPGDAGKSILIMNVHPAEGVNLPRGDPSRCRFVGEQNWPSVYEATRMRHVNALLTATVLCLQTNC
jgi:hypothetical protein